MAAGPAPVTFEVWPPMTDPGMLALQAIADRVAETCLASPRAAVTFSATVTRAADGVLSVALIALAEGSDPSSSSCPPAILWCTSLVPRGASRGRPCRAPPPGS